MRKIESAPSLCRLTIKQLFVFFCLLRRCFSSNSLAAPSGNNSQQQNHLTAEAAVTEALLTLSSCPAKQQQKTQQHQHQYQHPQRHQQSFSSGAAASPRQGTAPMVDSRNFTSPVSGVPQRPQLPTTFSTATAFETPRQTIPSEKSNPATANMAKRCYLVRPSTLAEEPAPKKARTVSPPPSLDGIAPQGYDYNTIALCDKDDASNTESCASCICPICNLEIKGLGEHKVDWSQPVQGRQRAKTITSIKKHVKDHHENEPIWNVIVNSLDMVSGSATTGSQSNSSTVGDAANGSNSTNRVVTAQAFVTQALKKAALDQIPNSNDKLRSLRWTEKMIDQRVGIAKGFIQFGGQEYLRNKECHDDAGHKINPKSLRNLAYCLLQSMYDDLMTHWNKNQTLIESAMGSAPLGLLRNRFQLLFAAPDKWNESWYMDPKKFKTCR